MTTSVGVQNTRVCESCGAVLSELPSDPNVTSWGTAADKDHKNIVEKKCECCQRLIRVFTQNLKQSKYCPDCQAQRSKGKNRKPLSKAQTHLPIDNNPPVQAKKETSMTNAKSEAELIITSDSKIFRDPVHKDIELRGWEVDIVDTPEFQRLKRIKQLGSADLVYPGAVHNRFLHSIGTVFVAQNMIDFIRHNHGSPKIIEPRVEEIIRAVALLHDIGHLPFGHTLEKECNLLRTHHDQWQRLEHYLGPKSNIARILGAKGLYDDVKSALISLDTKLRQGNVPLSISDLVGNTICADLLDYLKRDGLSCGLNLEYDDRIFRYFDIQDSRLVVHLEKHGQHRRDNVSELLTVLRNRYSLAEKVIFHHTKLIGSAMLAKAFQLSGFTETDILHIGQEELLAQLTKEPMPSSVIALAKALQARKLYKIFFTVPWEDAQIDNRQTELHSLFYEQPAKRLKFEKHLEQHFQMDEGSIIIYCPDKEMLFKPADVLVVRRSGTKSVKLSDLDEKEISGEVTTLRNKHSALWIMYLLIDPRYYHLAKQVSEEFKIQIKSEGIFLENALDRRPLPRFELLITADDVLEEFCRDKDLKQSEKDELRRELSLHVPSTRPEKRDNASSDKLLIRSKLRQFAESWYERRNAQETT